MKLHSIIDIITNSSSTTFIVGFEKVPENTDQMWKLLFPNGEKTVTVYDSSSMKTRDIARRVFEDSQTAERITDKEKFFNECSYSYDVNYSVDSQKHFDKQWEKFKDLEILIFEYASDSGEIVLEYGDIFKALPNVPISCH